MALPFNKTLIERAKYVIELGKEAINQRADDVSANNVKCRSFKASGLTYLLDLFGEGHPYFNAFKGALQYSYIYNVEEAIGIMNSVINEIERGWLASVKSIVSAEIFSDFLEMAEYLLSEGYKDPSAVMIGSVLEEHLRQLCVKYDIDLTNIKGDKAVPKKADLLNAELCSKDVHNKLDQKSITSWLDLRNKAAHGKYSEYTKDQVELMYQGVLNFIARIS